MSRISLARRSLLAVALVLSLVPGGRLLGGYAAAADAPDAAAGRIQAFYDVLLGVMKQADKLGVKGRADKLGPVIESTFDMPTMARLAVGPAWAGFTPDQQTAVVTAFTAMTVASYASEFDGYSGESFVVEPVSRPRGNDHIVESKLVKSDGEPVQLNYLMRGAADHPQIVDIYLGGTISQLATHRSEFAGTLQQGGADGLISSLKEKTAHMMSGVKE